MKLHLICATNGIPLSYELTPANVADVSLAEELITEAALGDGVARRLLGDPAYNSKELKKALAEVGILLATERSERRVERLYGQQAVRTPSRSHQGVVGMILTTDI